MEFAVPNPSPPLPFLGKGLAERYQGVWGF